MPATVVIKEPALLIFRTRLLPVSDIEVVGSIHGKALRVTEHGRRRRAAISAETLLPPAGNRGDDAGGRKFADGLVPEIRDIQIPQAVHREADRLVQCRVGAGAPITRVPAFAKSAGRNRDGAGRGDSADRILWYAKRRPNRPARPQRLPGYPAGTPSRVHRYLRFPRAPGRRWW